MQVLAPAALILAALALVILAFHIRRRRSVGVPSLVIWRQLQAGQVKRNRTWQWPKPSWSLALQLLALLAMVAALAQPLVNRGEEVDHWIFVLDRSGPMQAVGGGETLLDGAKKQIEARLGSVGNGRQSLISVGEFSEPVLVNQAVDAPGMGDAVGSVGPEDGPANWARLPAAVRPLLRAGEATHVVVFSDRPTELPELDGVTQSSVVLVSDVPNAAISAGLEKAGDEAGNWTLTGVVRLDPGMASAEVVVGFASEAGQAPLEWSRRTIGNREAVPAEEAVERSFSVQLDLPGAGIVSVALADDGNLFDNRMQFVIKPAAKGLDVLYIGEGNQPLLGALRAVEGTEIYQAPQLPEDLGQFGLVVVDNSVVDRQPESNVLWIGASGIGEPAPVVKAASEPTGAAAHPLMQGVSWADISTGEVFAAPTGASAEVVLRAGNDALVTAASTPFGRNITLGFDPRAGNLAQQPSLPAFVANMVGWLGLQPAGVLQVPCQVGTLCQVDRRYEGGTIGRVGAEDTAALASASWVPDRVGLFEIIHGERSEIVAVNPAPASAGLAADTVQLPALPLPLWTGLLALALVVLIAEAIVSGRGQDRFLIADGLRSDNPLGHRRRVALGLHVVAVVLALAALLNAPMPWRQDGETVVQVLGPDGSRNDEAAITVVAGAEPGFGSEAPSRIGSTTEALTLAAASVPWGEPGRIVVSGSTYSDADAMANLATMLSARDIVIDAATEVRAPQGTFVSALEAPKPVFVGDTFRLTGVVHADADQSATLRFGRGGETLVEQNVALTAGDNRVETIISDVEAGEGVYRLDILDGPAGAPGERGMSRLVSAGDARQVAVIANDPDRAEAFVGWLHGQGITGIAIEPDRTPYRPRDWAAYDGAVLIDLPAIALSTLQQQQLERAVAEQGLGLLILGGPNSFGPGGYLETPLEEASPLSSRVPRDAPEATLVFVLDRSGSMQQPVGNGTRLDVAKQATLAAVELLNRNSQVGIVVFDSEPTTVVPLSRIADPAEVTQALSSVDPGGGTSVYPGLEAAYEMLRDVDTPARHIIVMTDGLSQPADFPGLLNKIRSAGITVSSVSIGEGAERNLIEEIARLGGGSFHATDDFAALPSILSQEAMLLSGSPIEQGRTQPLWASRMEPFLRGLPATLPPIDGFVLTTAKPAALLSMAVTDSKGEPMPLMASWRYGAGQVLALTTEAVGPWTSGWQAMDSYAPFWAQVVRQFLPGVERGDLVLNLRQRGDGVVADLVVSGETADTMPSLVVRGDAGGDVPLVLTRMGAGQYQASYYPPSEGIFRFAASAADASVERAIAASYPASLREAGPDHGLLHLAVLTAEAGAERVNGDRWVMVSGWPFWLALAIAVFMLGLAVRYTGMLAPRASAPLRSRPQTNDKVRPLADELVHP